MKPQGWVVLSALMAAGCVSPLGRVDPRSTTADDRARPIPPPSCISRPESSTPTSLPPEAGAKIEPPARPAGPIEEKPASLPEPSIPHDPTATVQPPEPVESVIPAPTVPEPSPTVEKREVAALPEPRPAVVAPAVPAKPKGRAVARVGDEVVTLPELTELTKARLEQLGPGQSPSRRQVIALARSTLKGMIVRSLVFQEAGDKLAEGEKLDDWKARFERAWDDQERPKLLRREGVATDAELRSKLARSLATPESLRDEFVVRSLAGELIRRDSPGLDYDGYLDALRKRRPITSIMSPAELMAAGRRAAGEGDPSSATR